MSKIRKSRALFFGEPALLHKPAHKATRDEVRQFWEWANVPWNAGVLSKIKRMKVQVACDFENARQFPPITPGEPSPVFVGAFLPGRRPLRVVPMLNADHWERVKLTYAGEDDDSRLYVALMSLCYGKPMGCVRNCETCKKGFVATHGRDRFCSTLCRVKWHAGTPEGKAKHAAYMRDLRAKKKRLWEVKQRGRTLKRGRNVHVNLKKGE